MAIIQSFHTTFDSIQVILLLKSQAVRMSKRTKTPKRPSKKFKKSVVSQSEDEYKADSSEQDDSLDEEYADPTEKSPAEYVPRKRVRPAPVEPKNQAPNPEIELQKKVKADYGTNCEKLEARILEDASILGDVEKLRLLEKIFGIKKVILIFRIVVPISGHVKCLR